MKVLITGGYGFVGRHLVDLLADHELMVFDVKNNQDIRDYEQVRKAIDDFRPDRIYHLAAIAYVPESNLDPKLAIDTNITGSLNVLEAVRRLGLKSHILLAGSSEEYGDSPGPLTEQTLLRPLSPYAAAKAAMDHLGQFYAKAYNMHIVVTRAFNHTGPGRGEQYAESAWAKQIVEIERKQRKLLLHGDLNAIRNYTDVRDMVKAYQLAIELPPGVYNICSDMNVSMDQVLKALIDIAKAPVKTKLSKQLQRPADFSFAEPSCDKFTALSDWRPQYGLQKTLRDILNYWRAT